MHEGNQVKELMMRNIVRLLHTDDSRVNVKARTHEKVRAVVHQPNAAMLQSDVEAGAEAADVIEARPSCLRFSQLASCLKESTSCASAHHLQVDSVGECRALECHVVLTIEQDPVLTSQANEATTEV